MQCADYRTKQKILSTARAKGHLEYGKERILVLQDLSVETLEARHRLKPLTAILLKHHIQYRWSSYTKVQVLFKGVPLISENLDTGAQMLQALNIDIPPDFLAAEKKQSSDSTWHPV